MKNNRTKQIEKRLSDASKQMIPGDMYNRITQSIAQKERTMSMNTNSTIPTVKKRATRWIGVAVAACILLACGIFGGNYYLDSFAVDSIVDIDVNPGIEISTNKNNLVLNVAAVNSDAEKVLDGMNLKNTDLKVALNAIIGSMVQNGYLIDGENSILVTVKNKDEQRATHIRNLVLSDIDASLKDNKITASIVNQTVSDSADAKTFATTQGISFGKATFVLNLCAKDDTLDSVALAGMNIREIAKLVVEKNIDIHDIVNYDTDDSIWENIKDAVENTDENIRDAVEDTDETHSTNQSTTVISADKAKEIAINHAGVSETNTTFDKVELDTDDGVQIYELEFYAGSTKYDYEINANTGIIISSSKEAHETVKPEASIPITSEKPQTSVISAAKAKEIALNHAGVSETNATFDKVELDTDDGVQIYELEFYAGSTEYDYEINANTGIIISSSKEAHETVKPEPSKPITSEKPQTSVISAAKAKEIALNHAGVSAVSAVFINVELDTDDGVQIYEIEFCVGTTEYEYEINALTGSVINYESETDD